MVALCYHNVCQHHPQSGGSGPAVLNSTGNSLILFGNEAAAAVLPLPHRPQRTRLHAVRSLEHAHDVHSVEYIQSATESRLSGTCAHIRFCKACCKPICKKRSCVAECAGLVHTCTGGSSSPCCTELSDVAWHRRIDPSTLFKNSPFATPNAPAR